MEIVSTFLRLPNSFAKWLYYYAFPPAIIESSYCFTIWIITNCGKILKRREYQTTLPASWETCIQVKKQQLEPGMQQWTGSKLGKESRLYIITLLIELICRVHHAKCQAGWSTSWNQDCQEKYQSPQICRWHHPYGRKWRTRASWWKWKRRVKKLA